VSWKAVVLSHHPDAVCLWAENSRAWIVYVERFAVGVDHRHPAGAWKMAAKFVLRRAKP
jgi:hypothetical protein